MREVGCIHSAQGFELDYFGVIPGNNLVWPEGLGWDQDDLRDGLLDLVVGALKQGLEYDDRAGVWHDVYVTTHGGRRVNGKSRLESTSS